MLRNTRKRRVFLGSASLLALLALYACGGASQAGDPAPGQNGDGAPGSECDSDRECASGSCVADRCASTGSGATGSGATGSGARNAGGAGSGTPKGGSSNSGAGAPDGAAGDPGSSTGGTTGAGTVGGKNSGGTSANPGPVTTPGPHFPGSGTSFRPLTVGCGPATADACTGTCEQQGGDPGTTVIRPPATLCFAGEGDGTPEDPAVVIEQVIETVKGQSYVHIRVTFDPSFTDNTFGAGSCCGWPQKRGHRFGDLTGSDHTELLLTNGGGDTVMNFKIDLITADPAAACGFRTLGVSGGDGSIIQGSANDVLAVATSLDRNLNGCGYCESEACGPSGDCTVDSPATDTNYTPNSETPNWDYRQVYEVWIALDAFGSDGFGQAYVTYTHSSPAKTTDTITVEPTPCPPEWATPYCPPSVALEGGNCFGGGGNGGAGSGGSPGTGGSGAIAGKGNMPNGGTSAGGAGGNGGGDGSCPPNYQIYLATEGASICTPIPFANYPGMTPCPAGYTLDLASEGQYCLPTTR